MLSEEEVWDWEEEWEEDEEEEEWDFEDEFEEDEEEDLF